VDSPQVHVPYARVGEYLEFIKEHRINLEIFFRAQDLADLSKDDLREMIDKFDHSPTFTIHAPFMDLSPAAIDNGVREVTRDRFAQVLDAAEVIKPKAIVFHSGYEKWKYGHNVDIWLERSLDMWPEFIRRATDIGAKIAIENIFEDAPDNLKLLMEELASEHCGICFDTGHMNIFSSVPLKDWLDALGSYIVELHLHDNQGDRDAHLPVGDGTFDFDALFGALKGKDLIRTVEATSVGDVLKSLERLKRY